MTMRPAVISAGARFAGLQNRTHPRQQLTDEKRLAEIVVGAAIQSGDAVFRFVQCRQQNDRCVDAGVAQLRNKGKSLPVRQTAIKQDGVIDVLARQLHCVAEPHRMVDDDALPAERRRQRIRHCLFVFDQQKSHASPSLRIPLSARKVAAVLRQRRHLSISNPVHGGFPSEKA